jgi:hypothetical protein
VAVAEVVPISAAVEVVVAVADADGDPRLSRSPPIEQRQIRAKF